MLGCVYTCIEYDDRKYIAFSAGIDLCFFLFLFLFYFLDLCSFKA